MTRLPFSLLLLAVLSVFLLDFASSSPIPEPIPEPSPADIGKGLLENLPAVGPLLGGKKDKEEEGDEEEDEDDDGKDKSVKEDSSSKKKHKSKKSKNAGGVLPCGSVAGVELGHTVRGVDTAKSALEEKGTVDNAAKTGDVAARDCEHEGKKKNDGH